MREITPEPEAMIPAVRSAAKALLVSSEAAMAGQFRADVTMGDPRREPDRRCGRYHGGAAQPLDAAICPSRCRPPARQVRAREQASPIWR
jgi:hypothetical protein